MDLIKDRSSDFVTGNLVTDEAISNIASGYTLRDVGSEGDEEIIDMKFGIKPRKINND